MIFHILSTTGCKNWLTPQNDRKNGFTKDVPRYVYTSTGKATKMQFFFFFFGPYMIKFQKFPYHENFISY